MRTLFGFLLVASLYVMIYYRLLARYYYTRSSGVPESAFWSIFMPPPYRTLPENARKYVRRYWYALAVLIASVTVLALSSNILVTPSRATTG